MKRWKSRCSGQWRHRGGTRNHVISAAPEHVPHYTPVSGDRGSLDKGFPCFHSAKLSAAPSLPPSLHLSSFFHLLSSRRKQWMELLDACNFRKTQRCTRERAFSSFCLVRLRWVRREGGAAGERKGRGEMLLSFSTRSSRVQCTRATNPLFRGERNRCVLIASFHACIIRLHASRTTGREYRIYSRYSIKAGLWIIIDISIFRSRRFEKFRKIERKREERYVDLLSFREFKNKKILLLILSKLFFFFCKIYNYGMEKSLLRCVVISKRDIIYASRIDYGNCPKISARKRRLQFWHPIPLNVFHLAFHDLLLRSPIAQYTVSYKFI